MTTPRLPGLTLDDARSLVEATIEMGRERGPSPGTPAAFPEDVNLVRDHLDLSFVGCRG